VDEEVWLPCLNNRVPTAWLKQPWANRAAPWSQRPTRDTCSEFNAS
jgi:hypothetical protein